MRLVSVLLLVVAAAAEFDVTTLAGQKGNPGSAEGAGRFNFPAGIAIDGTRDMALVARCGHAQPCNLPKLTY